jgi:putative endonuclease
MSTNLELGNRGEALAEDCLVENGYQILERNWRFSRAEVDIIAKDGEVLVFVEVKTRSSDIFGKPEESVSPKKEALIKDAAAVYMEQINHQWEIRFDIISILIKGDGHSMEHFKDAFFCEW